MACTFTLTVFVSALLLFVIQPLAGELILPVLGGSSAVWTTVMLFFQVQLLAGYIYAHGIAQNFSLPVQVVLHVCVVVAAVVFLPADVPEKVLRAEESPAISLIWALMLGIGPPTFVVSSSAPLFQHWFGGLRHPHADDPYYLYAASNAGSLIALLSYPFLIERFLTLGTQQTGWTVGFLVLALLTVGCGTLVFTGDRNEPNRTSRRAAEPAPTFVRRAWWVIITFLPSSLMLGVTHYLTMDLASVPLLWVVPLALYLLTYILVFARIEHPLWLYRLLIPGGLFLAFGMTFADKLSIVPLVGLHLVVFFFVALYFHGRLARDRPSVEYLTGYYICMALGGSLGGVFNALVAPVLFDRLVEYFLVMALAAMLILRLPARDERVTDHWLEDWAPHLFVLMAVTFYFMTIPFYPAASPGGFYALLIVIGVVLGVGTALAAAYRVSWVLNAGVALLLFVGFWCHEDMRGTVLTERSFYGQYEVYEGANDFRVFMHGTTIHGKQKQRDGTLVNAPTGYYHPSGPFGDLFRQYDVKRVAIGGLGTGGIAPYREEGDQFHFFEIDPTVERIARTHFDYLNACGEGCRVKIGDARRMFREQSEGYFDLLIMDAYTSDAIPTHLLTREAVRLYVSRVKQDGVVVLHISNRHFNLERVVAGVVRDLGLHARVKNYTPGGGTFDETSPGFKDLEAILKGSTFDSKIGIDGASGVKMVVVARTRRALKPLVRNEDGWRALKADPLLWTDNYTNIVPLLTG